MANTLSCWINRVVGTTLGQLEQKPPAPWMLLVVCFLVGGLRILLELFLQNLKDYLVWVPYHHPSTRLKAVFPFPYLVEGIAGALCVVIGMSVTANDRVPSLNEPSYGWLVVLALLGFALSSPFKDHKDIKGDQAAGIDTVYVVSLKNGISPARLQWCIFSLVALNHLAVVGCAIYMGAVLWVVTALE